MLAVRDKDHVQSTQFVGCSGKRGLLRAVRMAPARKDGSNRYDFRFHPEIPGDLSHQT